MKNEVSKTVTGLIYQGQRALPGILANLASLGYSAAQGAAFAARISDVIAARDGHATAKVALNANRRAYKALVKTARGLAMTARDAVKPYLGREHSSEWIEAGFPTSLGVEEDGPGLLRNVQGLKAYYTAHPEHENTLLNLTAARFDGLATDLMTLIASLDTAKSNVITAADDRDDKAKLLREELRLLLGKLRVSFDPFAAIWELVGFNRPGFTSVPGIPSNLVAVLLGATSVALKWVGAERAERYRIYKKVVGVDEDFVLVETRGDLDFTIEGLPANAQVQIAVSAVNSGGESDFSQIVTIATH